MDDRKDSKREKTAAERAAEANRLSSWHLPSDTRGRVVIVVALAVILVTIWFMLDLVIVTFILTFVFYHLQKYAMRGLKRQPIKIFQNMKQGLVLLIIYLVAIGLLVLFIVENTPMIMKQVTEIASTISGFESSKAFKDLDPSLQWFINQIDFDSLFDDIASRIMGVLASFGPVVLNFLLSLLISFLLIIEKHHIVSIGRAMETSRIAFIYRYIVLFGGSFCYTFGKVMKVQVLIAAINCVISVAYLTITGFPHIAVLGLMIFILGLIPVMGVFISLVPLLILAFNLGGIIKVIEVIVMIVIIHCIEAYFLNPKLMSRRTSLPVSIVFIVLIISQKYLGAWGMLIGIPIFIYIMNVLAIDYRAAIEGDDKAGGHAKDSHPDLGKALVNLFGKLFKKNAKADSDEPDAPSGDISVQDTPVKEAAQSETVQDDSQQDAIKDAPREE